LGKKVAVKITLIRH